MYCAFIQDSDVVLLPSCLPETMANIRFVIKTNQMHHGLVDVKICEIYPTYYSLGDVEIKSPINRTGFESWAWYFD